MLTDHERWEHMIPDYLSGQLSESDSDDVRRHMTSCAQCSRAAEKLRPVFSLLEGEKSQLAPARYFGSVLPSVRARIEASSSRRRLRPLAQFARPVASVALLAMIFLTLGPPWQVRLPENLALSEAIGDVSPDALAEALANQAHVIDGPEEGSLSGVIPDPLFEMEVVHSLLQDRSTPEMLDASSDADAVWLSDLSDTEVTILLQRLSEREML